MWRIVPLIFVTMPAFADAPPPFEEPQGELTLQRAVDAALLHSPKLAPYAWDLRIGDARIAQARLRPNPELSFEIENIVLGGGADRSSTTRGADFTPATVALDPVVNNGAVQLQPTFTRAGLSAGIEREKQSGAGGFANAEFTLSLAHFIELGGKRAARIETAEHRSNQTLKAILKEANRTDNAGNARNSQKESVDAFDEQPQRSIHLLIRQPSDQWKTILALFEITAWQK